MTVRFVLWQKRNNLCGATPCKIWQGYLVQVGTQFPIKNVARVECKGCALSFVLNPLGRLSQYAPGVALHVLKAEIRQHCPDIGAWLYDPTVLFADLPQPHPAPALGQGSIILFRSH